MGGRRGESGQYETGIVGAIENAPYRLARGKAVCELYFQINNFGVQNRLFYVKNSH
jgi:hypothetical protein